MVRTVKSTEERRLEIIQTAEKLFRENGYSNTPVDAIITEMGVAKGTFYYYFKSKEAVLSAIVDYQLDTLVKTAQQIADDESMDAVTKLSLLLSDSHIGNEDTDEIVEYLHLPANRQLHEETNIQTVLKLSPIFAQIIEQGNKEKSFKVKYPLETMQFLLAGGQFLLDSGLFDFTREEILERRIAMQEMVEKTFSVPPGTFNFMNSLQQGDTNE